MRHPEWQQRLIAELESWRSAPFVWGQADCCLFTAACCAAQTGIDPAARYRGRYNTRLGARRALANLGSIEQALDAHYQQIPIDMAQRGDAVLFRQPGQPDNMAGIVWAGQCWTMTELGARPVPDAEPLIAWRVTCPQPPSPSSLV